MYTSSPPRKTMARKPSHFCSYRNSPDGSASTSRASIGSTGGAIGYSGPALGADVTQEDVHDQHYPADRGGEEEQDGDPGIAEQAERRRHVHQQRRADDQRSEHQSEGDAVRDFLQAFHQPRLVEGVDPDLQVVVGDAV